MKWLKLSILLLFLNSAFSQSNIYDRYSIKNNTIYWKKTYQFDSIKAISGFKNNLKLPNEFKGKVENQKLKCVRTAIYMHQNFQFNYNIQYLKNEFTVTVAEIQFYDSDQIIIGNIQTTAGYSRIEDYEVKKKNEEFRKNSLSNKNLECLDNFFDSLFNPQ
jgi:hypothetical protein